MFLSVKEMEVRKVRFDETYAPGEIEFVKGELWQATPLHATGAAELLANTLGEVRVRGHLTVSMEAACDRCLETSAFPVDSDFDLFYRPVARDEAGGEVEIGDGESDVGFYRGAGLELADVLREHVLLSLPMQRVCREECKGICPVCGQNRNRTVCGCRSETADDRWSALRDL